jgi:GntR family transcriptional regulator
MPTISISAKLHEDLAALIASTPSGGRLLTEPALAKQLGVSRATLREAMRAFEAQGLIRRRQGSGTYVTPPSAVIETGLEVLESIEKLAQRIDLPVRMGILRVDPRPASEEECQMLGTEDGCQVVSVSRAIYTESRPVAYLVDVLPSELLTPEELEEGFTGSVLDLLLQRGSPKLAASHTEIGAISANSELAKIMGIQRDDVLLRFIARLYDVDNRVVDYSLSYFLPGYFRFHVVRKVG